MNPKTLLSQMSLDICCNCCNWMSGEARSRLIRKLRPPTPWCLWMRLSSIWIKIGRNVIGQRTTVDVPGHHGSIRKWCGPHLSTLGPYKTEKFLIFLNWLSSDLYPNDDRALLGLTCHCLSLCGIMWTSTVAHVPGTDSSDILECWICFYNGTCHFSNLFRSSFQLGGGRSGSFRMRINESSSKQ